MRLIALAAAAAACATPAAAGDYQSKMQDYVSENVVSWARSPILIEAIRKRNTVTSGLSDEQILTLDTLWRAEVGMASSPTISPIVDSPASAFLREKQEGAGGMVNEVFVMDARGLNVAVSEVTSDYWQGDEAKFTESFGKGPGSYHFSEVEFDESSQAYSVQVSFPLFDPVSDAPIGALTVGLNADAF